MYVDRLNEFCDNTALNTGAAGTYLIGNQIDLVVARDVGIGNTAQLYLVAQVSEAATSDGSATLQLQLASDSTASIATDGTASVHLTSATFAVAALTAGKVLMVMPLPLEGVVYERFLGIRQITGTAAFTGGKVDVFLTTDPQVWKAYADEGSR